MRVSVFVCFVLESSLYPEDAPEAVVVEHYLQKCLHFMGLIDAKALN